MERKAMEQMTTQTIKHSFKLAELNSKIRNLESNGFEEYLNTWEKETVNGDLDMNHVILTATKGYYDGMVCDIYFNEKAGLCWLEYSGQRKDTKIIAVI
jgi:uncharacterized protein YrrD